MYVCVGVRVAVGVSLSYIYIGSENSMKMHRRDISIPGGGYCVVDLLRGGGGGGGGGCDKTYEPINNN